MARIDYTAILDAIADVLEKDADIQLSDPDIQVQTPVPLTMEGPLINIFEGRRDPTSGQDLAAGTRQRYAIRWDIWVSCFSAESFRDAAKQRDELLGKVEVALMKNRNLGGALGGNNSLTLLGGELRGGAGPEGGFIAQATLGLTAEAVATTT